MLDKIINPIQYAIPIFILLIIIEIIWSKMKSPKSYNSEDTTSSLYMGIGNIISGIIFGSFYLWLAFQVYEYRIFEISAHLQYLPICLFIDDFLYYWFHRCSHRIRIYWASHVNHHSSQHYNYSAALRQTWTGWLAPSFIFYVPLYLIGFHPFLVIFANGIHQIYQFWIHTEAIKKLPKWFEYTFNTPSHHRVHHAVNAEYLDANYGGIFIIWDRIFGTFVKEDDAIKIRYGIVSQLPNFNVFIAAFHEWFDMVRDVVKGPPGTRLKYLFGLPGWSHDASRETTNQIQARWQSKAIAEKSRENRIAE